MRAGEKVRWRRALEDLSSNPLHLHFKTLWSYTSLTPALRQTETDDRWNLPAASLPLGSVRDTVIQGTGQKVTAQDTQHFSLACTSAHTCIHMQSMFNKFSGNSLLRHHFQPKY